MILPIIGFDEMYTWIYLYTSVIILNVNRLHISSEILSTTLCRWPKNMISNIYPSQTTKMLMMQIFCITSCNLIILLYFNNRKQIVNDHENAFILLEMDWSQVIGFTVEDHKLNLLTKKKKILQ